MPRVHYFSEDIDFVFKNKKKISDWISSAISAENKNLVQLNFIFCSDDYLLEINKSYLNHNNYTDIITFDNSDNQLEIEGDIYISIDRINENKDRFQQSFKKELYRVIIHGVLHLIGYGDKTAEEKNTMQQKEDHYLQFLE